jgi:tetratricopeptide (TPR) repeat protein
VQGAGGASHASAAPGALPADNGRRPAEQEARRIEDPGVPVLDAFDREMRLGDAALYSGRFEDARQHFLHAMDMRVDSMSPALGALRAMAIKGAAEARHDIAARIERRVTALRADETTRGSGHLLAARLALALGENGAALDAAYLAVLELPELGAAWRVLGEAAMADEYWGDAIRALRRALALGVRAEAGTWERLADALDETGALEEAEAAARRAVELTGDDEHAVRRRLNLLAVIIKHRGDVQGAREVAARALTLGADDPAVLHNLAAIAEAEGSLEEAAALYRRALEGSPVPMTSWRLGKLLLKMERPSDAAIAFTRAYAHIDRWTWPASLRWQPPWEVGKLLARAGRFEEAVGWFEDALREARDGEGQREVRSWLAWARARMTGELGDGLGP